MSDGRTVLLGGQDAHIESGLECRIRVLGRKTWSFLSLKNIHSIRTGVNGGSSAMGSATKRARGGCGMPATAIIRFWKSVDLIK